MSNILSLKGVCKGLGGFSLKNIDIALPQGYIMGFVGPNGSGKTTTIKAILGMLRLDAGEIRFMGQDASSKSYDQGLLGVVMDTPFYPEDWTAADTERAIAPFYAQWDHRRYHEYLGEFGIDMRKKLKEMSRGMRVKLMLAAALSHGARLLILDEPSGGMDPLARDELMDILRSFILDENRSVLFSTHITTDLEKAADYITLISGGAITYTGTRETLMDMWRMARGGAKELTQDVRACVAGLREHGAGFEGLVHTQDIRRLPGGCLVEAATLEDIVIFTNREGKRDAQRA